MTTETLYLLDTNVLVHYSRRSPLQEMIESKYGLKMAENVPIYSYVSEGELRSFAVQHQWGKEKQNELTFLLGYFRRVPIERPGILEAYAQIDVYSHSIGIGMGKNDLWIAATARVTAATLLTMDHDFDHLDGWFLRREWIDPAI